MMKIVNIYSTSFWGFIQKLMRSSGARFLLFGKMLLLVVMLLGIQVGNAQEVGALRVGDYVPKDFWDREVKIYNQGDTSIMKLSKFKGKSLLIDFWATWCGYCIQGFPKLVEIQKKYSTHFNILLVNSASTKDNYSKIQHMKSDILRKNDVTSVFEDDYFKKLFPHGPIPHYVWISPKGRVVGITFREFVDEQVVQLFINHNLKYEDLN